MRGDIAYKILDLLEDGGMATVDFFASFLAAGYGASFGKMEYQYRIRDETTHDYQVNRQDKRNLQKYIYKLKSQGLVSESGSKELSISSKGKKKLTLLKKNKILDKRKYKKQNGERVTIISYDIPIRFNRERDILREILKLLGFHMIHKSVWVGKVKLPINFLQDAEKIGILKFIEILEVTKSGTLKSM